MVERCSNCSAQLADKAKYCYNCGQEQRDRIVPVKPLVADILRDFFAFDTKFFRTVPALLTKPGFLSEEFSQGRRARYIPAVRMYIFISVVAFLVFSLGGTSVVVDGKVVDAEEGPMQISGMNETMAVIDSMGVEEWQRIHVDSGGTLESIGAKFALLNYEGRMPLFLERYRRQVPLAIFFVIPLLALVMKLLFRKRYFVEQLIFMFHFASFILFVSALAYILSMAISTQGFVLAALVVSLIYLYLAVRKYYQVGWLKSLFSVIVMTVMGVLFIVVTTSLNALYSLESL